MNKVSWSLKALKPEENKKDIKSIGGIFPKDRGTNKIKNEMYDWNMRKLNEKN